MSQQNGTLNKKELIKPNQNNETKASVLVRELQELTGKKTDNFEKTVNEIYKITELLNNLVSSLGSLVEETKVIDSKKANKYLLEEDVDKILLVNGFTTADLERLSVANKKKKVESCLDDTIQCSITSRR